MALRFNLNLIVKHLVAQRLVRCLKSHQVSVLVLCDNPISWVGIIKYLGLHFISGQSLSLDVIRHRFYMACNSINVHSCKQNELTQLYLFESYCLPIFIYCSVKLSNVAMSQTNACSNSVYRRIFAVNRWESVHCF